MRTRTKFCALVAVLALAAPVALSQGPTAPEPAATTASGRLLPTTAAAYADYQGKLSGMMVNQLGSAKELDAALDTFGAPNIDQLGSSWMSFSGILAAQDVDFTKAVRNANDYYGPERFMVLLERSPQYASTLDGGKDAVQTILAASSSDASRVSAAGAFIKKQSYTLQKVGWAKEDMRKKKDPMLDALRASAKTSKPIDEAVQKLFAGPDLNAVVAQFAAAPSSAESVWDKVQVFTASAPGKAFSAVSPVAVASTQLEVKPGAKGTVDRMVTLAALHELEADRTNPAVVKTTMADPTTTECLASAQRNMFACLSGNATRYEQVAGLRVSGEMQETYASCVTEIAK